MLYITKISDYLKILTEEEVKDLVLINFGKYFTPTRNTLYSKRSEKNLIKVDESFYSFLPTPNEVEKYVELIEKFQK